MPGSTELSSIRGAGPMVMAMSKASLHFVAGRMYRTDLRELVVGRTEQTIFRGLDLGDHVLIHGAPGPWSGLYGPGRYRRIRPWPAMWTWCAPTLARPPIRRPGHPAFAADFRHFRDALMSNPQLNVQVKRLTDYYRGQMGALLTLFGFVGYFVNLT